MIRINDNYLKLEASYLFAEMARRTEAFEAEHPERPLIRLGIGDVTEPLPAACLEALHRAVDELGHRETFRGYGTSEGYPFLRESIVEGDFASRGVEMSPDAIFVSDGAKGDTGGIQEIFTTDTKVAVPDPIYPVYVDTNVMAGRAGSAVKGRYTDLVYLDGTRENDYISQIPNEPVDLIYLCFPNNPTGATATTEQLQGWVNYARECGAVILFDAAYEAYIRDPKLPHSIFELEGAKEVAIEFRSFSKTAGFTGTRCAYTIVPPEVTAQDAKGQKHSLQRLWYRRQSTKSNGVSYPIQRAAAAAYSDEGQKQISVLIDFYLENARIIREGMIHLGYSCVGGDNSPYIWVYTGEDSWASFDRLLKTAGVVCSPGVGFGTGGEGHLRFSAFNSRENVEEAIARLKEAL